MTKEGTFFFKYFFSCIEFFCICVSESCLSDAATFIASAENRFIVLNGIKVLRNKLKCPSAFKPFLSKSTQ